MPISAFQLSNGVTGAFNIQSTNEFSIPIIDNVKRSLNVTKNLMDAIPTQEYTRLARKADPYADKRKFKAAYNSPHVTNAWLKIEQLMDWLLTNHKLNHLSDNTITAFCNAEFPGAFILGLQHFCKVNKINFDWKASSVIDEHNKVNYLVDEYKLYANNPDKWLMSPENNGDVTIVANLVDMKRQLADTMVNLYTSDLGFQVTVFNRQEEEHLKAHFGACIAGLMTLKPGGIMILKMFTLFTNINMSLIAVLTTKFTEFHIVKPDASRELNSECYLVGIEYQGISDIEINKLLNIIADFTEFPIIAKSKMRPAFVKEYISMLNVMSLAQEQAIAELASWEPARFPNPPRPSV
jgi:23S rRNA U2552 (ribose-2'-O)-methylase RlmE/FtsJ